MTEAAPRRWVRVREALQRRQMRWLITVAMTLVVSGLTSPFVVASFRLDAWRQELVRTLRSGSLEQRDAALVSLREKGTVEALGETFSSERLRQVGEDLFDSKGRVIDPMMVTEVLLLPRYPDWAPTFLVENPTTPVLACAALLAAGVGSVWLGMLPGFLAVVAFAGSIAAVGLLTGRPSVAFVVSGMAGLVVGFVLLMRLLLAVFGGRAGWVAVAQTVVREAVRLRISAGFIGLLLVVLPLIPLFIDPRSPLRYQIQTFMARGLDLAYVCAACLTLMLGCATVAFEIRDRQIWQLMTKPLARLQYLLGKWAGIVALDAVLLLVCGIGIFLFVQWMRLRPAMDEGDRLAVRDEVLVARESSRPPYRRMEPLEIVEAVDAAVLADTVLKDDLEKGRRNIEDVRRELGGQIQKERLAAQRQVAPGQGKVLQFSGLQAARRPGETVTLRFLLHAGASDTHSTYPVIFRFSDGSWIDRQFIPSQSSVLPVPAELISEDGTISVEFLNMAFDPASQGFMPGPLTFNWDEDAVEVLYRVGGFEANYLRAMAVNLIKLSFLAMLAVCSATFLSFPVACLLSFAVFLAGSLSPFLAEALRFQTLDFGPSIVGQVVALIVYAIAITVEFLMRPFGQIGANDALVRGLNVGWGRLGQAMLVIGAGWTGLTLAVGWLAFRRRELATYSGQG